MSYTTVLEGLHERLATVAGLNVLLPYAPTAVYEPPLLFSMLDSVRIVRSGQVRAVIYRIRHRVVIRWQDNEQAEVEVASFVDAVPLAVEADPHLGGRLVSGFSEILEVESGFADFGEISYRVVDFYSTTVEK